VRSALDVIPTAPQPSCAEERRCYKHSASNDPVFVFLIMSKRVTPIVDLIAVQNVLALPVGAGRRVGDGRILERRNNYSGDVKSGNDWRRAPPTVRALPASTIHAAGRVATRTIRRPSADVVTSYRRPMLR
jgi:hypothetical protein